MRHVLTRISIISVQEAVASMTSIRLLASDESIVIVEIDNKLAGRLKEAVTKVSAVPEMVMSLPLSSTVPLISPTNLAHTETSPSSRIPQNGAQPEVSSSSPIPINVSQPEISAASPIPTGTSGEW